MTNYALQERARAARWKKTTSTLPHQARRAAQAMLEAGTSTVTAYEFCLPSDYAACNLLPGVRAEALALFGELGIPWHHGVGAGPGNHLLSSQVQCANALIRGVRDPGWVLRAFAGSLPIAEVLEIEPGRFLTFEYIGERDYLGERVGLPRIRGAKTTSADAAIRYRSTGGEIEIALIEWKYIEAPAGTSLADQPRLRRYRDAWAARDCPVRTDLIRHEALFAEPFYQLLRQQLLAHAMENAHELGATRVRVLHVSPRGNAAYRQSLGAIRDVTDLPGDVLSGWQQLLVREGDFVTLDSGQFADAARSLTEADYVARYGPSTVQSGPRSAARLQCPQCSLTVVGHARLVTHLHGRAKSGGHEASTEAAEQLADRAGGSIPRPHAGISRVLEVPGSGVTDGHRDAVAMLAETSAARQTLALYRAHIPSGVYLRPTDAGLTVISLDAEACRSVLGVGSGSRQYTLSHLPPAAATVKAAHVGYLANRDALTKKKIEEQFALRCIRQALANELRLPQSGWSFLHQEWRFPGSGVACQRDGTT
jgi:hypothetical protein